MKKAQSIYALYGAGDTGKTTTLTKLKGKIEEITDPICVIERGEDFSAMFDIKGQKVAIISAGDNEEEIHTGLKSLDGYGPFDILFCASRTRGQTTHYLINMFEGQNLRWVDNMSISDGKDEHNQQEKRQKQIDLCNEAVASFLFQSLLVEVVAS